MSPDAHVATAPSVSVTTLDETAPTTLIERNCQPAPAVSFTRMKSLVVKTAPPTLPAASVLILSVALPAHAALAVPLFRAL